MIPEGTPDWVKARVGQLTGSRMADAIAITLDKTALCVVDSPGGAILEKLGNGKAAEKKAATARSGGQIVELRVYELGEDSAARKRYLREVVAERLTGFAVDHYVSPAMQWGLDHEHKAKEEYEAASGNLIQKAGFELHREIPFFGATPDGLIDSDGCLEVKCPTTDTHLNYLLEGVVPVEYKPQMISELMCHGRQWCDFVSFDPRLPKRQRLFIRRFEPTAAEVEEIRLGAIRFLADVERMWEALHS